MSAAAAGAGAAVEATKHVLERVAGAAERAGRRPDEVRLVAVTKGVDVGLMDAYLAAGIARDLGENRAQELDAKHSALAHRAPRWHFIGTLQRNKAGLVVGRAVSIHSVDSERLARAIGDKATALGIAQRVLLEVNTSGEVSKHGVTPGEAADVAHAVAAVSGVELGGFMTMAPPGDPSAARACFSALRDIRDAVARHRPDAVELSMGMTGDFEIAIAEGATIVRVGTAIFGPRPTR